MKTIYMSYSLNSLRGMHKGVLWGLSRWILGVSTIVHIMSNFFLCLHLKVSVRVRGKGLGFKDKVFGLSWEFLKVHEQLHVKQVGNVH